MYICDLYESELKYHCQRYSNNSNPVFTDSDFNYFDQQKMEKQNIDMITPVKTSKALSEEERQRDKAYNDLFSKAVSKDRQPIASFFNWLNEHTNFQRANKVRSNAGLLIHAMGKIAIAFIYLIF